MHFIVHAGIRLAEQRPAGIGQLLEVRLVRRGLEIARLDLCLGQQAVLNQQVKVDQIRVARCGRKALVRRIAEAGMAERQYLPVGLVRIGEEIDKVIGGFAHRAHTVRRGQGSDMRKHATRTFEHRCIHYNTVRPISQEIFSVSVNQPGTEEPRRPAGRRTSGQYRIYAAGEKRMPKTKIGRLRRQAGIPYR